MPSPIAPFPRNHTWDATDAFPLFPAEPNISGVRYFFHIYGPRKLQVDKVGLTFTDFANAEDHARFRAKDLSGSGLEGHSIIVAKENGDIVLWVNITP